MHWSLALADRLLAAGTAAGAEMSASERAAVVTLLAHPGQRVSWLGDVLGLTSSGITRLVDRLAEAGWVTRTAGPDARSRQVQLTHAGRIRARAVLRARQQVLADALGVLSQRDRIELERLLHQVVTGLATTRCRRCRCAGCVTGRPARPEDVDARLSTP